ncbi:hypothetical protein H9L39_17124, partial [Fusarium oxysporum f. sp. albedinis]
MTTWISIDNATHARKRRAMNHAFSDKALRSSEPFIHSNIDRWIELLKEEIRKRQWSCSLHMARWADRLECFTKRARIEDEMQARCKSGTESRKDFFQYLFLALDLETGKGCSNEEVFSESGSLIIAGSDTGATGGIVVGGRYIPEGTKASTVSYCMHHDPDMYPEPFEFRPER